MESTRIIFKNTLKESRKNPQILTIIRDISFDLARKKLKDLSEDEAKITIKELFELFALILKEEKLKDAKTISSVIDALTNAASYDKKEYLFKMIYEREQLEKAIYNQSVEIKHFIVEIYDTIENALTTLKGDNDEKGEITQGLNDAKLLSIELLGILKDSAEEAFITTIEKGSDVEDTVCEISKLLTYHAISEGKFVKQRILDIASTVLEAACDIADSDHANALYVLKGAAKGTKEGIIKASEKFKKNVKFAPDEIKEFLKKSEENKLSIIDMEESFIELLKRCQLGSMDISAKILGEIIAEQNTYIAKLKRFSAETAEVFGEKMEVFRDETLREFKEKAGKKITEIKKETGEKVTAFTNDAAPKAKQFAGDAKKLGLHAWELAKNKIDGVVKNTKKKGD
ncbi:MAG: hypothetical protein LBB59_02330 [Campylobacteraceae bacterium]|jgi:uncharacterized protein (UPF0335 family)|nr:hypothetical protein [Campylobacteraceae bacterium]